jgi:integrase
LLPNDTKYLKHNGSTWIFQKRLSEVQRKALNITTQVHNVSLKTNNLKLALIKRDTLLNKLNQITVFTNHPSYSKALNAYAGMSPQEIKQEHDHQCDHLSTEYPYVGHPQYTGGLAEPSGEAQVRYQTLKFLNDPKQENTVEDRFRLGLRKALDALMEEKIELPIKTKQAYQRSVDQFLEQLNREDVWVYAIKRMNVRKFIASQLKGFGTSTVKTQVSNLGSIWKYVRDAEDLDSQNPFMDHKIPNKNKQHKYYKNWTIDELRSLLQAFPDTNDQLPIYIAWYTGSRLDEVYSLSKEDIYTDLETKIQVIAFKPEGDGKNIHATRILPVHTKLKEKLESFTGWNRPSSDAYGKYFSRVKKECGFISKEKSFHSIRGNACTNLENMQVPENIANKIIGHKSRGGTMTYGYYSQGPGLEEVQRIIEQLPIL